MKIQSVSQMKSVSLPQRMIIIHKKPIYCMGLRESSHAVTYRNKCNFLSFQVLFCSEFLLLRSLTLKNESQEILSLLIKNSRNYVL